MKKLFSIVIVQTQCLSGKESGSSWQVLIHTRGNKFDSCDVFKRNMIDRYIDRPNTAFLGGKYKMLDTFC